MKTKISSVRRVMKGVMLKYMPGMISCAEFEHFIDDYLDDNLTPAEVRIFERHIKMCRECWDYIEAYRTSIELGKKVFAEEKSKISVPDSVPPDLLQAMLEARRKK